MQHEDYREVVRNLEAVLRICDVSNRGGRFITGLEEKHAMGILQTLTEGLENGNEHMEDILPATELMLIQLTANPKSRLVQQCSELKNHFFDSPDQTEELSKQVVETIDWITSHITPELSREKSTACVHHLDAFLNQSDWNLDQLKKDLEQIIVPPASSWVKG